jgi:hypothetical protein
MVGKKKQLTKDCREGNEAIGRRVKQDGKRLPRTRPDLVENEETDR